MKKISEKECFLCVQGKKTVSYMKVAEISSIEFGNDGGYLIFISSNIILFQIIISEIVDMFFINKLPKKFLTIKEILESFLEREILEVLK